MPKFYKAESRFFVGRRFTPESMVGVAEAEVFRGYNNEQFYNRTQGLLAQEYLLSSQLLLSVVDKLRAKDAQPHMDLYAMTGINEPNEQKRQAMLIRYLRRDLIRVTQLQNSGVIVLSVELTNPTGAAVFVNSCVDALMAKFSQMEFQEFEDALKAYQLKLTEEWDQRQKRATELAELNAKSFYDRWDPVEQKRKAIEAELDLQAEWIAELTDRIEKLRMGTSAEAKAATQPVKIIDRAYPPDKKSRPQTILTTLITLAIYTFVFMVWLVVIGYLNWTGLVPARSERT